MIGVVGLGRMGSAIARRLVERGRQVVGFDVNAMAGNWVRDAEAARVAGCLSEVGALCDSILLSLPGPSSVRKVIDGPNGLLSEMKPGGIIIDTSTTDRGTAVWSASCAARKRLKFVDAPVCGGVQSAASGTLTALVGGSVDEYGRASVVLGDIATQVLHVGDVGAGQALKLCHQLLVWGEVALVAEAVAVAKRSGLGTDDIVKVLELSPAGSVITGVYGRRIAAGATEDVSFPARLALKDQMLYGRLARDVGLAPAVSVAVEALYARAVEGGYGERDASVVGEAVE